MNILNLDKLNETNNKLIKSRIKTYEQVRNYCYNRINIISKMGKLHCWFIIPIIIPGSPPIDIDECANYLKYKLNAEPILYTFYEPNIFYITWNKDKIKKHLIKK
jgi:hypothetical protein